MRIIDDIKLDFDDVLIVPKRSTVVSRGDVNLYRTFKTLNSKTTIEGIPIMASNMDCVGVLGVAEVMSKNHLFTCLHKFYNLDILQKYFTETTSRRNNIFYSMGITDKDFEKLKAAIDKFQPKRICVDVANGYTKYFIDAISKVREIALDDTVIMAGNVATPDMTQEILINGRADIVKIGIGPGSACETRRVTGVGYPQLSAIIECADVAHGIGGLVCADGGCRNSGDIAKALGAGADFVMLGGLLAGHTECEGEWFYDEYCNYSFKYYGMSSKEAMTKYYGEVANHRAPEGTVITVKAKGPLQNTINNILGGLRSTCTYVGTDNIKNLSKCTTFVKRYR